MDHYTRRQFVATGAIGTALLAGCLSDGSDTDDGTGDENSQRGENGSTENDGNGSEDGTDPLWTYDTGASLATVTDGILLGREEWIEDGSGGVLALDTDSGDKLWTFGETGGYTAYTRPVVDDAIYTAFRDDAIGSGSGGLYALERDGTVRWERDTGSVYHTPQVADGTVYVGGDDGVVSAFDAVDGENYWTFELDDEDEFSRNINVETVADGTLYATDEDRLLALDATDGTLAWSYRSPSGRVRSVFVTDRVYCGLREGIVALAAGEKEWWVELDSYARLRGVTDDVVYVQVPERLYAFDPEEGDQRWDVPVEENSGVTVGEDALYTSDRKLTAYAHGGESLWSLELDDGEVKRVTVDNDVYATTEDGMYRVADGEIVSSLTAEGIRSIVRGETTYVGTRENVAAFDL